MRDAIGTIGVFDGVHIGHIYIIRKTVERAKKLGSKSVVVTFDPHPLKVLRSKSYVPTLISLEHRMRLISELGVDRVEVLKFTKPLSRLSPEKFVKDILIDKFGLKEIYVGENFYFGHNAQADPVALKRLGKRYGFQVRVIRPLKKYGRVVSSSLIRGLILKGEISKAAKFLGRPVSVLGTVVKGESRGRILGFPTANVNPHHEVVPPPGVYAVRVKFRKRILQGVLNIGLRPTFYKDTKDLEPTIEVHILDFNKDIYNEDIEIFFVKKIRNELRFSERDDLMSQIKEDIRTARIILA